MRDSKFSCRSGILKGNIGVGAYWIRTMRSRKSEVSYKNEVRTVFAFSLRLVAFSSIRLLDLHFKLSVGNDSRIGIRIGAIYKQLSLKCTA
jgi:hypothetical protein